MFAQFSCFVREILGNRLFAATFSGVIIFFTMVFSFLYWKPMLSPKLFPDVRETLNDNLLSKWWANYTHPLVVSPQTIRPNKGNLKFLIFG